MKDKNTVQEYWDEMMGTHPSRENIPERVMDTFKDMFYGGAMAMMDLHRKIDLHPSKEVRDSMKKVVKIEMIDFNMNKLEKESPEMIVEVLGKILAKMSEKSI